MEKQLIEQWEKNRHLLKKHLETHIMDYNYADLVKLTFSIVIKSVEIKEYNWIEDYELDIENMTVIDDGNYQGTEIFMIPFDVYQPNICQYLITYSYYGSCSGCDTLLRIISFDDEEKPNEQQVKDLMTLCLHLIQHAKLLNNFFYEVED